MFAGLILAAIAQADAASPPPRSAAQSAWPVAHAVWVDSRALVLDGDPAEWIGARAPDVVLERADQLVSLGPPPTEQWSGPQDCSAQIWLAWNETDLVLGGVVRDEVTDTDPNTWWQGDSVELFLNFDGRASEWRAGDFQVMLAPDSALRPWGVYARDTSSGQSRPSDGGFGGVEVSAWPFSGGYRFEARLPWRNFDDAQRRAGESLPLNLALCDRDSRGRQESYLTWTGERELHQWADRRGELVLDPSVLPPAAAPAGQSGEGPRVRLPSLMVAFLAGMYALALWTRRVWRKPTARWRGLAVATALISTAALIALAARLSSAKDSESKSAELALYASRFERLVHTGALGAPEPAQLVRDAQALLAGKSITPQPQSLPIHLAPEGGALAVERSTAQRGLPFRPILSAVRAAGDPAQGIRLAPGESCVLALPQPARVDALQLVTRVSDPRYALSGTDPVPILSVELLRDGAAVLSPRDVRHRQDLHLDEDEHREHPGLEPAFFERGGHHGRRHADGLLIELGVASEIDAVRVRHVGVGSSYAVQLVAASALAREERVALPAGLRTNSAGEWEWSEWRADYQAEVLPRGRVSKIAAAALERPLALGSEPAGTIALRDSSPQLNARRWDSLPIATAAALAPFLVALLAEWLAARRRIRGKLAVGFAITSAVPLLVLTLLLEASLGQEHEISERERVESLLARAEADLDREQRELEREARRLLQIVQLRMRIEGRFAQSSAELSSAGWWGEGEPGAVRLFERVDESGRRERIGTGPGWQQIPRTFALSASGLIRPWGRLYVSGVAQTASGAEQAMAVLVARPPQLLAASAGDVHLLGAERDPVPASADLREASPGEERRALFAPTGELAAVLVAAGRQRGVPVLGDYSLNELLLAAGLTAVFTAMLFAGILTGHIVGPIERLHRAVREKSAARLPVEVEVQDEVGHLTGAVHTFARELESRVRQLETLHSAQEEFSSHLDPELAREAVLSFFMQETRAVSLWLLWCGETGEEPRLLGRGDRNLAVPDESPLLARALASTQVIDVSSDELAASERLLLDPARRILCLPLVVAGHSRGSIVIGVPSREAELDLAFLRTAAAQAAIVLENARLYRQAVSDAVTGFLSDPGFKQRVTEEIQRAETQARAGVLIVQVRIAGLPADDARAAARLREAAKRMRQAVRGLAVFGRSGSSDLRVAIPWTERKPSFETVERRIVERVGAGAWPDGESVVGLLSSHAAWPDDGPSGRVVLHCADERLVQSRALPSASVLGALQERLPLDFVAQSPLMVELLDTVRRLAEQDVTVLVVGETGVGKDRIAQLVHQWSRRPRGPLVHIHCPSLSASLIEDELFGHEPGAFTGATSRRVGPFVFASGGTVVLDEVGGLCPAGQVGLLRLLETREVIPLGATRAIPLDVRIVATTSTDLATEVERGRFRSDLYFRLNVAQLSVPPLRLRRQDLPALVDALVRRFNATADRPVTGVAPAVMDLFFDHAWPGNLRELENKVARALILADGGELRAEHVELDPEPAPTDADRPGGTVLNERQIRALEDLAPGQRITSSEHARSHGISTRTALRDLLDLVDAGYLSREGEKRGVRFRRTARPWAAPSRQ